MPAAAQAETDGSSEDILLRDVKYQIRADVDDPVRNAVEATSLEPIIQVFAVKAWGKDKSVEAGQAAFLHRARMNGLATRAEWTPQLETA